MKPPNQESKQGNRRNGGTEVGAHAFYRTIRQFVTIYLSIQFRSIPNRQESLKPAKIKLLCYVFAGRNRGSVNYKNYDIHMYIIIIMHEINMN